MLKRRLPWSVLLMALPFLPVRMALADANGDLIEAARTGSAEQISVALAGGADADATGEGGITALMYAAASGHPEAVQRLLEAHAQVNTPTGPNRITPMRIAVATGSVAAARQLLAAGADANETDARGSRLLFAAAGAGHVDLLELLLVPGEDVNFKRADGGFTALDAALDGQHWAAAEFLLSHGATLASSIAGRDEALLRLLELEPVVQVGTLSLVQTVELPSPALFHAVLAQGARIDVTDAQGNSLLMLAAKRHHLTALSALLEAGLDVNARNRAGDTPLAFAAGKSEYELMVVGIGLALGQDQTSLMKLIFRPAQKSTESAATARRLEAARLLLSAMADPNMADTLGDTPLLEATRSGDAELVSLLIASGAEVNARNETGSAPLLHAAQFGLHEIASLLLAAEADPDVTNEQGQTPLQLAEAGGHAAVVELLKTGS